MASRLTTPRQTMAKCAHQRQDQLTNYELALVYWRRSFSRRVFSIVSQELSHGNAGPEGDLAGLSIGLGRQTFSSLGRPSSLKVQCLGLVGLP
jgi:hypothetical protein